MNAERRMRHEQQEELDNFQAEIVQKLSDKSIAAYRKKYEEWKRKNPDFVEKHWNYNVESALAEWIERWYGITMKLVDTIPVLMYSGHTYDPKKPKEGVAKMTVGRLSSFDARDVAIHEICHYLVATHFESGEQDFSLNYNEDADLREEAAGILELILHVESGRVGRTSYGKIKKVREQLAGKFHHALTGDPIERGDLNIPENFPGKEELIQILRTYGWD